MAFTLNDDQAKALRKRLGLAEDATEEEVAAAIMAEPSGEGHTEAAGSGTANSVPKGMMLVDQESYKELQSMAARGDEAARRLANADRDQVLETAATIEGKFPRSRIEHWKTVWDKDPEGTRTYIAAMAKNVVPVSARGYTGSDEEDIDAEYASIDPPKAV